MFWTRQTARGEMGKLKSKLIVETQSYLSLDNQTPSNAFVANVKTPSRIKPICLAKTKFQLKLRN